MDYEKYGIVTVLVVGIVWLVKFIKDLMREHRNERKEWQQSNEKLQDHTNQTIKENTNILAGLKTLLEHRK
jgi:hypothetical protein